MVRGFEVYILAAGLRNFTLVLRSLNLLRLNIPETPIIFLNIKNPIAIRKKIENLKKSNPGSETELLGLNPRI